MQKSSFPRKLFTPKLHSIFSLLILIILATSLLQLAGHVSFPVYLYVAVFILLMGLWLGFYIFTDSSLKYDSASLHDPVTDLPNHALFLETLEHDLLLAKRHNKTMVVVCLDIDKFTEINTHYGYSEGNILLHDIGERLRNLIRECDTLSRIGGDEFALVMNHIENSDELVDILKRISTEMKKFFVVNGKHVLLKMTYGACVYPRDAQTVDKIVQAAGLALDSAKAAGGNTYHFFNKEMSIDDSKRISEEINLKLALERDEFKLYFQPKVDAATGNIKGMEALIRWLHPVRGIVSPVEFIPLLEESGMIVEVGDWVLRESCRLNKSWQDQGFKPVRVSVNVSSLQFKQSDFIEKLQLALDETELAAEYLEIELTESCLMEDVEHNIDILNQVKEKGIAISVDDFGTGYSSLSYLKKFPIDTLKIDRSFITNVQNRNENDNAAIVTAIMALSHSLRLDVVAEGVETAQELSYLHALGCKTIQGFLFSKPLSEEEFTQLQKDSARMSEVINKVREELAG